MLKGAYISISARARGTLLGEFSGQTHLPYFVSQCGVISKDTNGSLLDAAKSEAVLIRCSKS